MTETFRQSQLVQASASTPGFGLRLCQGCLLACKVNRTLLNPGEDGGPPALNVIGHRVESCKLQCFSFGWPKPLAILKISVHSFYLAGSFHVVASQSIFHLWFSVPGLTAKEDRLPCHAFEKVALSFRRHSSASKGAGEISPDHLHLVEIVPQGGEIIIELHKHSAQVQLGVNLCKGDAVDGDDGVLGFALGKLEFVDAVGLLVPQAQFGVRMVIVKGIIYNQIKSQRLLYSS